MTYYEYLNEVLWALDHLGFDVDDLTSEYEQIIFQHMDEEYTIEESAREIFNRHYSKS